ncbi:MAG: DUF4263 domain-containing protein [Sphingobacteriales bacterium]|nr:MAG: DUF4263 domain-containing protein [Sphingobacteriales bacterium]
MFIFGKTAKSIEQLIIERATEREFQRSFKSDFSQMIKRYVHPAIQDEWIRFYEYPLGLGRCDFMLFTDRSRMHVVLFEIKGADFDFATNGETLAHPISKALDQML